MAYDEALAKRVTRALEDSPALHGDGDPEAAPVVVEKRMFGGVGYMFRGNMVCGVNGDTLIVRVGPAAYEAALAEPHTRPFDMTGRAMVGWVVVKPAGWARDEDLRAWVERGVTFALTLPAK
jgi:TfoX/Sxy family transcriptional regulator of competence genes